MAENHPVGFQWVMEARNGAKVIHVDPRSAAPRRWRNIWLPLRRRLGHYFPRRADHYALENEIYFREYVVHYTNAPVMMREDFRDTEDLDGVFSGWDAGRKAVRSRKAGFMKAPSQGLTAEHLPETHRAAGMQGSRRQAGDLGEHKDDPTTAKSALRFQVLKKHFARYTPEMVERYCGIPKEAFLKVAKAYCSASGPEKTGAICYAVGWTQHSTGVQIIRAAAILQLVLGNTGRPGGGMMALRGHASIQGSTDIPTLYDILPGYLSMPKFGEESKRSSKYIEEEQAENWLMARFR